MVALREAAFPKINLTLGVLGRRADGYHELSSLVAFARLGWRDRVERIEGPAGAVEFAGPFARAVGEGETTVGKAVRFARERDPGLRLGAFRVWKGIPVAAGLGGGSADAAAALRLIGRENGARAQGIDWLGLARAVGADVPVCLGLSEGGQPDAAEATRPAVMSGIGERVRRLKPVPVGAGGGLAAVLVNPGVAVSTRAVFEALNAGPVGAAGAADLPERFASPGEVLACVRAGRNDLEAPARALAPVIGEVLDRLEETPGCAVARMSGSGATCFGLFADAAAAVAAARRLKSGPGAAGWHIAPARLFGM